MFVVVVLLYSWCLIRFIRDDNAAVVVKHQIFFISFCFRKQPHIFLFALLAKNAFYFFLFLRVPSFTVRFDRVSPAKMMMILITYDMKTISKKHASSTVCMLHLNGLIPLILYEREQKHASLWNSMHTAGMEEKGDAVE